ncbi:hypothetical protein COW36_08910 [bacterium (Candidatus Blackallbacteria) CG17_big_fil_post_rev_8_21_14_2_50_48_46]|uniref:LysM domain-containing protein n=1 Tax=bacterium (Candidatus Blackallbacteria) CG17_big_fil_post_rev_8_21_14_2_50_48_46 TaxID=2014261 RepID=A0A2M7G6I6_9BACT|nr:MAG: hypothetical protein COW64_06210 [bacterium (Candidatus Blackallbacteria) CG18_big_fil_WC_8_21_14_2_50_49_26]PIW17605.1 MAG: hypothetical protein COW36_08910 [bacterium (Candidatus Blackallbacteria) CG17_big_fil_post_rev_8_21_14_2_50_48_46]PIW48460.1 MAG: hypothetical protein COW20_10260 [bacterium (Candidatus Blackallbacteria) CG13_big_fil_rev_8_21_14_2_50_49_14]
MTRLDFTTAAQPLSRLGTQPKAPPAIQTEKQAPPPAQPTFQADSLLNSGVKGNATPTLSLEPEPQFLMHKVKRGETLGKLAQKYLGNANRNLEIYKANQDDLQNPNDLRIGMVLKIPVPASAEPIQEEPDAPEPATPNDPTADAFTLRTVKRGESLSIIALRTLGDSERYMEIYKANRDILKTPDALQPGMQLKIPQRKAEVPPPANPPVQPSKPETPQKPATPEKPAGPSGPSAVDHSSLTPGAQELFAAMQKYQKFYAERGVTSRTKTTPTQLREIAKELDSASKAFGVDPKMMLALYAHESGGINPGARSHTGAGGLGQLTSIAIRQVHFMAGIGKGGKGTAPYNQYRGNFIQNARSIQQRYNIKANVWTSVAYMSYELNERARLGRGIEKALKRYGDPSVSTYANKVNDEYKTLFGGKLF